MVDVTHNRNNWRTFNQIFLVIRGREIDKFFFIGFIEFKFQRYAKIGANKFASIKVDGAVYGCHNAQKHTLFHNLGNRLTNLFA